MCEVMMIRTSVLEPSRGAASECLPTSTQLACLQLLETCVKNCVPQMHTHLATSDMWSELLKLASDTSISRASVHDLGGCAAYSRQGHRRPVHMHARVRPGP